MSKPGKAGTDPSGPHDPSGPSGPRPIRPVKRYLRIYLLAIVLPTLAVAWGGMRLLAIDARIHAAIVAD